jgi:hypothetical protein
MTDTAALDAAIRRFPHRLRQWRQHGIQSNELHELLPAIVLEYRIILKERANVANPRHVRQQ